MRCGMGTAGKASGELLGQSRPRLFDHDIAEIERLAGLDGELPEETSNDRTLVCRAIGKAVSRARYQDGEHDPAVGVGRHWFLVVDRVDPVDVTRVGREKQGRRTLIVLGRAWRTQKCPGPRKSSAPFGWTPFPWISYLECPLTWPSGPRQETRSRGAR